MSVLSSTCLYTHTRTHRREKERKGKCQCFFLQPEKKNQEKIKKRAFLQVRLQVRKDEGKKEGKLIPSSSSILNKRRKERKNASNELCPLSRVRAFLFLSCELFFRRSRERGEKNIIARKISHPRWDDNENKNVPKAWTRRVRSRPKLYQPRVSQTRTSRRARAPWAFSKSSRRERRKTQSGDALRRTSSLVCWWCYYAVKNHVLLFFAPVSYFPPPLLLSRYIILYSIQSRRTHRRDKK